MDPVAAAGDAAEEGHGAGTAAHREDGGGGAVGGGGEAVARLSPVTGRIRLRRCPLHLAAQVTDLKTEIGLAVANTQLAPKSADVALDEPVRGRRAILLG